MMAWPLEGAAPQPPLQLILLPAALGMPAVG